MLVAVGGWASREGGGSELLLSGLAMLLHLAGGPDRSSPHSVFAAALSPPSDIEAGGAGRTTWVLLDNQYVGCRNSL